MRIPTNALLAAIVMVACLHCDVASRLSAQERTDATDEAEAKADEVHAWASRSASELEVRIAGNDQLAQRTQHSLLKWSNPIAGEVFGDCYLWSIDERPVAFLSVYAFYRPITNRRVTFQSLSEKPLVVTRMGTEVWHPDEPGIAWLSLDDLPAPAPTSVARMRQMRLIANQFTGMIAAKDNGDEPAEFRNLRLLSRPIYQYTCSIGSNEATTDGAIYAFVDGTDPEILLMIESSEADDGKIRVAPIRQHHRQLALERDRVRLWEAPILAPPFPNPKISDPSGVYYNTKWLQIEQQSSR